MSCSVNEAQARITPQEFLNWIEFYKTNPPIREHMNVCQAKICHAVAMVNRGKGQSIIPLNKFMLDYKKAMKTEQENLDDEISRFFMSKVRKE